MIRKEKVILRQRFPMDSFSGDVNVYMGHHNQRTNGPVNAHLISWPSKAQNIQNLEKYMVKK